MLQAESDKLRLAWIQAVQASIASAYRESPDYHYVEVSWSIYRKHNCQTNNDILFTFSPRHVIYELICLHEVIVICELSKIKSLMPQENDCMPLLCSVCHVRVSRLTTSAWTGPPRRLSAVSTRPVSLRSVA